MQSRTDALESPSIVAVPECGRHSDGLGPCDKRETKRRWILRTTGSAPRTSGCQDRCPKATDDIGAGNQIAKVAHLGLHGRHYPILDQMERKYCGKEYEVVVGLQLSVRWVP